MSLAPLTEFWGLRIRVDPAPLTGLVLWPQDRRIHLDPTPLTRFCGLGIEGSTWILHPSQGSVASGSKDPPGSYTPQDRRIRVDPTPLTGFSGLRIEGSTWILHALQGAVAGSMHDPMCCTQICAGIRLRSILGSMGI